jgi:Tol biopolymer transport system component
VRVSPEGRRIALATDADVWTYDRAREARTQLTNHPASDRQPLWSPDGKRIIFMSMRAGYPELFWRLADGSGTDERLLDRGKDLLNLRPEGWSADHKYLLVTETASSSRAVISQIAIDRRSEATVLLKNEAYNGVPAVSPNGRWMAYESDVTGRDENRDIYIERYPELGSRQPISTGGGRLPLWSPDGQELFFSSVDGKKMFVVAVQYGVTLVAGRPRELFDFSMLPIVGSSRPYDIGPDGQFVIIGSGEGGASGGQATQQIMLVQNWFEELKSKVPTK